MANQLNIPSAAVGAVLVLTTQIGPVNFYLASGNLLASLALAGTIFTVASNNNGSLVLTVDANGLCDVTAAAGMVLQLPTNNEGPVTAFVVGAGFPASVTPFLWLDGRSPSYQDLAGTVPAGLNVQVANVPNSGSFGVTPWLSLDSGTSRPNKDQAGFRYETIPTTASQQGGTGFSAPAGSTVAANATTVCGLFNNRVSPLVNSGSTKGIFRGVDNSTSGLWGPLILNGEFVVAHNGTFWHTGLTVPLATPVAFSVRYFPDHIDVWLLINGVTTTATFTGTIIAGTIFGLQVALQFDFNEGANMSMAQLLTVSRSVTDLENQQLLAWLATQNVSDAFPVTYNFIAISGDSIGEGYGLSSYQAWAYQMLPSLESIGGAHPQQLRMNNLGIPSIQIEPAHVDFLNVIAPEYSTARNRNVLIVQVFTNSLAFGTDTAAQALAAYYSLCDDARRIGFRVAACTVLPRSDAGIRGDFETNRQICNTDIRANYLSHADALIDFAGVSGMGAAGDSNGSNYQSDHVHPSAAGMVLLTPVAQAASVALLS